MSNTFNGAGWSMPAPSTCDHAALQYFRILASEFSEKSDKDVCIWLTMTEPIVNERFFERMYHQALALLTAHRMKMTSKADDEAEGIYTVASISEDGASEKYLHDRPNLDMDDGSLKMTKYGQQYIELRRKFPVGLMF